MQVSNNLVEDSFCFTEDKPNMLHRSEEIDALDEIADYCEKIKEKIQYTNDIWMVYVQDKVSLADYLYLKKGDIREDDRRRLEEMLSKKFKCSSKTDVDEKIFVSLGDYFESKSNIKEYINYRRHLLSSIQNVQEYEEFMHSCFPNSCFAKNILDEMKNIENFSMNVKEITDNLAVLDDEAIELYRKYHANLKEAMNILTTKLIECSPDPGHTDALIFPFIYEEQLNGDNVSREKQITCSPHLKLIHKGSNLRIYFWWCDKDVGNGEKVLVGRIGRHPY